MVRSALIGCGVCGENDFFFRFWRCLPTGERKLAPKCRDSVLFKLLKHSSVGFLCSGKASDFHVEVKIRRYELFFGLCRNSACSFYRQVWRAKFPFKKKFEKALKKFTQFSYRPDSLQQPSFYPYWTFQRLWFDEDETSVR